MGAKRSAARLIDLETVRFTGDRWGDGRGLMGLDGFEFQMKKHQKSGGKHVLWLFGFLFVVEFVR